MNQPNKKLVLSLAAFVGMVTFPPSSMGATLIHHWTFDVDGSDSIGSANATFAAGVGLTGSGGGQFGEALIAPNTINKAVVPSTDAPVLPATDFTFVTWVNPASSSPSQASVMGNQNGSSTGAWIRIDNGALFGRVNGPGVVASGGSVLDNRWTHVAMSVSSVDGLTLYVNGANVANSPGGTSHALSTGTFAFGGRAGSNSQSYDGLIDDAAIFTGILTQDELNNVISLGAQNFDFVAAVPEPSSAALLGLAGIALILCRKK